MAGTLRVRGMGRRAGRGYSQSTRKQIEPASNHFTTQLIKMNIAPVGPDPTTLRCPSCGASIVTRVERKSTTKTHVIALLLCLFLCWPCVCVPYCMDSCQNADHYCPNCQAYLGTYQR